MYYTIIATYDLGTPRHPNQVEKNWAGREGWVGIDDNGTLFESASAADKAFTSIVDLDQRPVDSIDCTVSMTGWDEDGHPTELRSHTFFAKD
jgi:hypothetical protein